MTEDHLVTLLNLFALVVAIGILSYAGRRRRDMTQDVDAITISLLTAVAVLDRYPDEQSLHTGFWEADTDLKQLHVIGPAWRSFRRQVIVSQDGNAVRSPASADEFFDYSLLYRPEIRLRKHEAVPNQLVGIGLLFTFIGLTLSLFIASSGLDGGLDEVKNSLVALLGASAIKFVTSIAAISGAIWFTHVKNAKLVGAHSLIDNLAGRIDDLVAPTSIEQLAEETRLELIKQTELLEDRNDDLAEAIAASLDERLQTSLKEAIAPVAAEINSMAKKLGEINEAAMRYMVERFTKELGSAAQQHSERMTALLNEVSRAVEGVPDRIEAASSRFSEKMNLASDDVGKAFGNAGQTLASTLKDATSAMSASSAAWATNLERLSALQVGFDETKEGLTKRLKDVQKATDRTVAQLTTLIEQLQSVGSNIPSLDKVAEQLERAALSLEQGVAGIRKLENINEDAQHRAADASEKFVTTISSIESEMRNLDQSLGNVFQKTGDGLAGFHKQTESFVNQIDGQLAKAVERLTVSIEHFGNGAALTRPGESSQGATGL